MYEQGVTLCAKWPCFCFYAEGAVELLRGGKLPFLFYGGLYGKDVSVKPFYVR